MRVRLHCRDLAGETVAVGSSVSSVSFDEKGRAEVEATPDDLARYASLRWLVESFELAETVTVPEDAPAASAEPVPAEELPPREEEPTPTPVRAQAKKGKQR